jgi:glutathione S-transferase
VTVPEGSSTPAIFITIPLSHYCEKARWALDRVALPYWEQAHAPLLHLLATKRHAGGTVPVLVHGGTRVVSSAAILAHADACAGGGLLYPRDAALRSDVEALEQRFDAELGPHARRWVYWHLLAQPKLLRSVWSTGLPGFQAAMVPMIAPLARFLARKAYRITPQSAQRSLERVHGVFRDVDERLRDGRRFLIGNRFTAADLTFAALAAPVLLPVGCRATHPPLEVVPVEMRDEILRLRATLAGRFALRLFDEERG